MFAAVMMDPENCRHLLEMILNISIERVEVDIEKSIVYHPEYHGIRLDVFSKDKKNTRYSVEMQVNPTPVTQRSRYYHSEIDAGLLLAGASYDNLPDAYVIFICDYDPFQDRKYVYTVTSQIKETGRPYNDGSHTIILSTLGENQAEVAPELVAFLNFVHAGLKESEEEFTVKASEVSLQGEAERCFYVCAAHLVKPSRRRRLSLVRHRPGWLCPAASKQRGEDQKHQGDGDALHGTGTAA